MHPVGFISTELNSAAIVLDPGGSDIDEHRSLGAVTTLHPAADADEVRIHLAVAVLAEDQAVNLTFFLDAEAPQELRRGALGQVVPAQVRKAVADGHEENRRGGESLLSVNDLPAIRAIVGLGEHQRAHEVGGLLLSRSVKVREVLLDVETLPGKAPLELGNLDQVIREDGPELIVVELSRLGHAAVSGIGSSGENAPLYEPAVAPERTPGGVHELHDSGDLPHRLMCSRWVQPVRR